MKIALLQMTSGVDPAVNARTLVDAIDAAAAAGAAMLFTPEMSGLLDRDRGRARRTIVAEADDPVLGGDIGRERGRANEPCDRGAIDDSPAARLQHGRDLVSHAVERASKVDSQHPIPVFQRAFRRTLAVLTIDTRSIECGIEPAIGLDRLRHG